MRDSHPRLIISTVFIPRALIVIEALRAGTTVKGAPGSFLQSLVRSGMVGLGTKIRGCRTRAREVASEDWLHERAEDDLGPASTILAGSPGDR